MPNSHKRAAWRRLTKAGPAARRSVRVTGCLHLIKSVDGIWAGPGLEVIYDNLSRVTVRSLDEHGGSPLWGLGRPWHLLQSYAVGADGWGEDHNPANSCYALRDPQSMSLSAWARSVDQDGPACVEVLERLAVAVQLWLMGPEGDALLTSGWDRDCQVAAVAKGQSETSAPS